MGYLPTNRCCGTDLCSAVILLDDISSSLYLSRLQSSYVWTIHAILEWGLCIYTYVVELELILHSSILTMIISMFSKLV